jgi:hypothetical protein
MLADGQDTSCSIPPLPGGACQRTGRVSRHAHKIAQWMHTHTCHVTDCREKSVLGHSAAVRCSYMAGSRQHNTSCHSRVQSQPTPAQCSAVRQQHSVPSAVRQLPKQCQMKHQQYEHSGHSGHVHMPKNCLQSKAQKTVTWSAAVSLLPLSVTQCHIRAWQLLLQPSRQPPTASRHRVATLSHLPQLSHSAPPHRLASTATRSPQHTAQLCGLADGGDTVTHTNDNSRHTRQQLHLISPSLKSQTQRPHAGQ